VGQVLTFGTRRGQPATLDRTVQQIGAPRAGFGVTLVVKQHGGETGTGAACAEIVREVNDAGVWVNYDAGNVLDYLDVDPLPDIRKCHDVVRSFCLKDHRNWPQDEDCAPGFGEIDHYRLLETVAFTGRAMPLAFENIFVPLLPRPPSRKRSIASRSGRGSTWQTSSPACKGQGQQALAACQLAVPQDRLSAIAAGHAEDAAARVDGGAAEVEALDRRAMVGPAGHGAVAPGLHQRLRALHDVAPVRPNVRSRSSGERICRATIAPGMLGA